MVLASTLVAASVVVLVATHRASVVAPSIGQVMVVASIAALVVVASVAAMVVSIAAMVVSVAAAFAIKLEPLVGLLLSPIFPRRI